MSQSPDQEPTPAAASPVEPPQVPQPLNRLDEAEPEKEKPRPIPIKEGLY